MENQNTSMDKIAEEILDAIITHELQKLKNNNLAEFEKAKKTIANGKDLSDDLWTNVFMTTLELIFSPEELIQFKKRIYELYPEIATEIKAKKIEGVHHGKR